MERNNKRQNYIIIKRNRVRDGKNMEEKSNSINEKEGK